MSQFFFSFLFFCLAGKEEVKSAAEIVFYSCLSPGTKQINHHWKAKAPLTIPHLPMCPFVLQVPSAPRGCLGCAKVPGRARHRSIPLECPSCTGGVQGGQQIPLGSLGFSSAPCGSASPAAERLHLQGSPTWDSLAQESGRFNCPCSIPSQAQP